MALGKWDAIAKKRKPKALNKIKAGGIKKKKRGKKAPAAKKSAKTVAKKDAMKKKAAAAIAKRKKVKTVKAGTGKKKPDKKAPATKKVAEVEAQKSKSAVSAASRKDAKKPVKRKSPVGKKDVRAKSPEATKDVKAKSPVAKKEAKKGMRAKSPAAKKDVKPKSPVAKKAKPPAAKKEAKKDVKVKAKSPAKKAKSPDVKKTKSQTSGKGKSPAAKKAKSLETRKAKSPVSPARKKEKKKATSPAAKKETKTTKSPEVKKVKKTKSPEAKKEKSPTAGKGTKKTKKAKSPGGRKPRSPTRRKGGKKKKAKKEASETESSGTTEDEEAKSPAAKKAKKKTGNSNSKSRDTSGKSSKSKSSKSGGRSGSRKRKKKGRKGRSRSKKRKGKKGKKKRARSRKRRGKKSRSRKRKKKGLEEGDLEPSIILEANELDLRHYSVNGELYDFRLLSTLPKICGDWMILVVDDPQRVKETLEEEQLADQQPFDLDAESGDWEEEKGVEAKEEDAQNLVTLNEHEQILKDKVTKRQDEIELRTRWERKGDEKLLSVTVVLPEHAIWFEEPVPVRWNSDLRIWSTDAFSDVKFLSEDISIHFSTGVSGVFGFAANRCINMPYRGWNLESAEGGLVKFTLQAKLVTLKFTVHEDLVCVNALTEGPAHSKKVEEKLLNIYMKPRDLIKTLRECGINIFPEADPHAYMDEVLIKQADVEDHLYQCMAIVCPAYHFTWSKWNKDAGQDKLVLLAQSKADVGVSGVVLITSKGSIFVSCTEESKAFSDAPRPGMELKVDLLELVKAVGGPEVGEVIHVPEVTDTETEDTSSLPLPLTPHVEAVRLLLQSIRPLSYSA